MFRNLKSANFRSLLAPTASALRSTATRTYVAPINDLNFLIKDVFKFSEHYQKLGYDVEACGDDVIDMVRNFTLPHYLRFD
jgi:hypothetical protein